MNKSLLLIICDFLLISILAMVEFKPAEENEVDPTAATEGVKEDMVELLKMSLDYEASQRNQLETSLSKTTTSLKQTEQERRALSEEKSKLSQELSTTKQSLTKYVQTTESLSEELEQKETLSEKLQRELKEKLATLEEKEKQLDSAQEAIEELANKSNDLETRLKIRETEKQMLNQNLIAAKAEIERARIEADRAQQQVESLSEGVSELAANSSQINERIAKNETLSMNAVFRKFEDNRIFIKFNWVEDRFLGDVNLDTRIQSIPVQTERGIFAIFDSNTTPFKKSKAESIQSVGGQLIINGESYALKEVSFYSPDKRIIAIQIPQSLIDFHQLEPFSITNDPLRFEEAILVNNEKGYYGEIPVRAPPSQPNRLRIENKLFNRLFGEFSPSLGDYVLSRQSELIGIMTEKEKATLIEQAEFNEHLPIGKEFKTEILKTLF